MRALSPDYNFLRRDYWFGQCDPRPLALFRICFALLMLKVAFYFLLVADKFFSDTGITPRSLIWAIAPHHNRISLMDVLSETWMAQAFFGLWMIILVFVLIGYHTRLMLILNFLFIISVHARSFLILNGADLTMRILSFWALFLPLGAAYSVDAYRCQKSRQTTQTVFALPLRLTQLQIALIYLFTFLLKLEGKPWREGTALFYAFQIENYVLPTGVWILKHVPLWGLSLATYFTLLIEGSFILLVFLPFFQPRLRAVELLLGAALHIGIALTMAIHDFSMVMICSYLLFLDPAWLRGSKLAVYAKPLSCTQKVTSLCLIPLIGLVIWGNLATLEESKQLKIPDVDGPPRAIMQYLGLVQTWGMFAPRPSDTVGWITIRAQFENGLELDLMTGQPLTDEMTTHYWGPDTRWEKYTAEVWRTRSGNILNAWADYYCLAYNSPQQKGQNPRLVKLDIVYNWWWVHKPDTAHNPLIQTQLWQQTCST